MTFGYLAQPIDQTSGYRGGDMVTFACGIAASAGVDLFRPAGAYQVTELDSGTASSIDAINSTALAIAEIVFAVLPAGVPTLGTPVEIERSLGRGIPVVIVTDIEGSVQVDAWARSGALVVAPGASVAEAASSTRRLLEARPVAPEAPRDVLPYVRAHGDSTPPSKAYDDDAGLDLAACEPVVIPARGSARVRTGLKFALPLGMWGLIVGRSSTWATKGLDVKLGVIDAGWRGELWVMAYNPTDSDYKVEVGERLAQYILLPAWTGRLAEVEELPAHERGENGFGSSGH